MLLNRELIINGVKRRYFLFVPGIVKNNFLIIALHGAGGNAKISMFETNLIENATKDGFYIAFPDALPEDINREPDFKYNPQIWQAKDSNGFDSPDLVFIKEIINSTKKEYSIQNVFVTGFSNGAIMSSYLSIKIPDLIKAIAPVCGKLVKPPNNFYPFIPILLIIGDSDPIFPINGGEVTLFWGNRIIVPSFEEYVEPYIELIKPPREITNETTKDYEKTEYINKETKLVIFKIYNHGHIWPGGKSKLTYEITGYPNKNFSANDFILSFFKEQIKS